MKGVNKRNTEYENYDNKISSKDKSSSYLKLKLVTFNSSVTSMVKTCLAVTFLITLLLLVLSSVVVFKSLNLGSS